MIVINTIFNLLVLPSTLPPPHPALLFHCFLLLPLWHNFGFSCRRIISEVLDKHKKYTSAMSINCVLCWYLYVYKHWCGMEDLRKFKVNLQEQILTFHHVGSSTHWTTSGPPTVLERISTSYGCSLFQRISILCITLKKILCFGS